MITAMILVNVERALLQNVMDEILAVDGIVEVHSVVGEYDLAAIARVESNQQLSMIIADKMCSQIKGITHTKTLISLGSQFKYDAVAAYGIK
jgi:DNA-binding Lrp family transcriptional regulator